jgi:hypothetical protein
MRPLRKPDSGEMASKRRIRRRECLKKIRYDSIEEAREAAVQVTRKTGFRQWAYGCHWCSGFHIGHTNRETVMV